MLLSSLLLSSSAYAPNSLHHALRRPPTPLDAPEILAALTSISGGAQGACLSELMTADVWALGVLAVCMLGGQPPAVRAGAAEAELKVQLPPGLAGAPSALTDLIFAMLRVDPSKRLTALQVKARVDMLVMPPPPPTPPQ